MAREGLQRFNNLERTLHTILDENQSRLVIIVLRILPVIGEHEWTTHVDVYQQVCEPQV
jgi:hypothetical protein